MGLVDGTIGASCRWHDGRAGAVHFGVTAERGWGTHMARYTMRQRLVSIGEDFDIADEHGNPAYRVDGKALRLRETFVIEDLRGREVATIREKKLALRESMDILRGGSKIATIRKARFAPFRARFSVDVAGGQDMVAQGTSCTTSTTSAAGTPRSPVYQSSGSR